MRSTIYQRRSLKTLKLHVINIILVSVLLLLEGIIKTPLTNAMVLIGLLLFGSIFYPIDLKLTSFRLLTKFVKARGPIKWIALYLMLAFFSLAWTSDTYRSLFYIAITTAFCFLLLFWLITDINNFGNLLDKSLKFLFIVIGLKFIFKLMYWNFSTPIMNLLHGLGGFEAAAILVILFFKSQIDRFPITPFFFAIFILVLGTSLKAYISIAVFVFMYFFFSKGTFSKVLLSLITLLSIYYIYVNLDSSVDLGKLEHGSGRIPIFLYLLEKYINADIFNQILGFGYVVGDKFEMGNVIFYNSHNLFLSALLNLGLVGFYIQIKVLTSSITLSFNQIKASKKIRAVCIASVFMIYTNALVNQSLAGIISGPFAASFIILIILTAASNPKWFESI